MSVPTPLARLAALFLPRSRARCPPRRRTPIRRSRSRWSSRFRRAVSPTSSRVPLADAMGRALNVPVVIENKAGAGGGIGMGYVAKAKPDGYTLLLALSSISILPEADKVTGRAPMYQFNHFAPIARFTADPTVLAVRADSPWKTLAEFVADASKRPGAITYGSSGNYGTMHVPMEMFAASAGIKLLHVPYTGAGPAVVALLGGNVDALSTGPSTVIQHVKAGKLRVLASWGDKRLASLPDVPTLTESGYPVVFTQWTALFAPAGTPEPRSRNCATPPGRPSPIRSSSPRWRPSKRRSSTSMRRSCSASGTPTTRSSARPCAASARSNSAASVIGRGRSTLRDKLSVRR